MRKKYTSKTYMRGVTDRDLLIIKKNEQNYYIIIKKINNIDKPFVINSKLLIDKGYYIMEFTPLNQFYNARVFLDRDANVIEYYFDISNGNGAEDNIPYYTDLYLDVIYSPNEANSIKIEDENELLEALNTDSITTEEYNLACNTCTMLIEEIKENKNIFINMDKKGLIKKYFMWIYNSSNKKHGLMFKYILYVTILRLVWNTTNLFFF